MRLFVGIAIDDQTRAQLALARAAIHAVVDRARVPPRLTWVRDENAHVTLRFIGETSEPVAAEIQQALVTDWLMSSFHVRWEHLGAFPSPRRPRVLWVGPESAGALVRLAGAVNDRLDPIIGPGEARPFTPHLTLARVKQQGSGVDWSRAVHAYVWVPTTTHVDRVTLYLSRLSPKGPTYTAVCTAPL